MEWQVKWLFEIPASRISPCYSAFLFGSLLTCLGSQLKMALVIEPLPPNGVPGSWLLALVLLSTDCLRHLGEQTSRWEISFFSLSLCLSSKLINKSFLKLFFKFVRKQGQTGRAVEKDNETVLFTFSFIKSL